MRRWTDKEDLELKENWFWTPDIAAMILNRSVSSVKHRQMKLLGKVTKCFNEFTDPMRHLIY